MFSVYSESLLLFFKIFDNGFMIYIILIFSSFNFFKIMTSAYLSKHYNFVSVYDGIFSNFSYYKCLCSNASKHFKMMHKHFLKYPLKHK